MEVRKITNRLIRLAEDGVISWSDIADMCLCWMSEDDVVEMCQANCVFPDDEDEE